MTRVLWGAFLISFSSVFVKLVQIGPTATMFYRLLFGGSALLLVAVIQRNSLWVGWRPALLAFAAGAVFSLDLFFWHRAIEYVGPGLATILANFQVFSLAIIGILFLKERPGRQFLFSIPLAVGGLLLIVGWRFELLPALYRLGIVYGLLTAACYTAVTLILHKSRRIDNKLSPVANMALVCLFGAGVGSVEVCLSGESFSIAQVSDMILLLAYGLICSGLGWSLITSGLGSVPASTAGLALVMQPACAFIWDILLFDRPTTVVQLFGAVLTLGAIYFGAVTRSSKT